MSRGRQQQQQTWHITANNETQTGKQQQAEILKVLQEPTSSINSTLLGPTSISPAGHRAQVRLSAYSNIAHGQFTSAQQLCQ